MMENNPCDQCKLCDATWQDGSQQCRSPFLTEGVWFDNGEPVSGVPEHSVEGGWIVIVLEGPDERADKRNDLTQSDSIHSIAKMLHSQFPALLARTWLTHANSCYTPGSVDRKGKVSGATDKQVAACRPYITERVDYLNAVAVIPVGAVACLSILKQKGVLQMSGRRYNVDISGREVAVFPVWAVGYGMASQHQNAKYMDLWSEVWSQITESKSNCVKMQDVKWTVAEDIKTLDEWWNVTLDVLGNDPVGWDTETTGMKPWRRGFNVFMFSFHHPRNPTTLIVPHEWAFTPHAFRDGKDNHTMLSRLKAVMESAKIKKMAHNGKFDSNAVAARFGWHVKGAENDTMIMEYCADPNTLGYRGLDDLVRKYARGFGEYWKPLEEYKKLHPEHAEHYDQIPPEIMIPYCACDTAVLHPVREAMDKRLRELAGSNHGGYFVRLDENVRRSTMESSQRETWTVEDYALKGRRIHHLIACELERNGLNVDKDIIGTVGNHYVKARDIAKEKLDNDPRLQDFERNHLLNMMSESARKKWIRDVGVEKMEVKPKTPLKKFKDAVLDSQYRPHINWGSVLEVQAFFGKYLNMPVVKKTDAGAMSVDADALGTWGALHNCEPAERLLEYRNSDKFLTSYIFPMQDTEDEDRILHDDDRVHADIKVASVVTGRLATCVDRDTLITTTRGLVPIHSLEIGDFVLTHKSRYKRCLNVFIKSYDEQYRVTTSDERQIVCTAGHRFFTEGGEWISLRKLDRGDKIVVVRGEIVEIEESGETWQENGFVVPRLRSIVQSSEVHWDTSEEGCGQCIAVHIVSIDPLGVRETWDCTIEDDESYVGNGFQSHNSAPNVQAWPRDGLVKRIYNSRFENGWITQRDYSGLEVRILALFSREPALLEAFRTGQDPHFRTQSYFFKEQADKHNKTQRSVCKRCLFGRIYGQGDQGLLELLRKERVKSPFTGELITLEECTGFNEAIDQLYPKVCDWVKFAHQHAIKNHWCSSAFGFTIPMPEMVYYKKVSGPGVQYNQLTAEDKERRGQVAGAMRHAQNYPIQGTASDITTFAAWRICQQFRKQKMKSLVVLIVHDAIYVDGPQEEVVEVNRIMKAVMDYTQDWLPEMLPGYDASWIDIPIIGEGEVGCNAKDALAVKSEPDENSDQLILSVPDEDDGGVVKKLFGDAKTVSFADSVQEVREYLNMKRFAF